MSVTARRGLSSAAGALVLASGYLAVGLLWIGFSDEVGRLLFRDPESLTRFQTWKGFAFVAASAAFLFAAVCWRAQPQDEPVVAPQRAGLPLVTLLSLIVLATMLPMVALLGWNITRETRSQLRAADTLVRSLSEGAAGDATRLMETQQRAAASLAQRASVRRLDPRACDPLLQEVAAVQDVLQQVSTFDSQGRLVCGPPERRSKILPPWYERLRATRQPMVGPLERDGFSGAMLFTLAYPMLDGQGALAGAVELLLPVSLLANAVSGRAPGGGTISLVDQRNVFVARSGSPAEFVGTTVRDPQLTKRIRETPQQRTWIVTGPDGVERLTAVTPVGSTGWLASAGVPVDTIQGPARRALLRSVLVAVGILALCVWLVLRLARAITTPLNALRRTAERAATGDFGERAVEAGPAELAAVAAGFNHLMERLPRLQQQLRESESRQRAMIEKLSRNLPGVIYISHVEPDGRATFPLVSSGAQELFELDPSDVARDGRVVMERIHPLDRGRVQRAINEASRALRPLNLEYRVLLPRGGLRHVLSQGHPERGEGDTTVWYGAVVDVSELRTAQQALEHANITLEQRIVERTAALAASNEALESFSYSVAHDLRAPLASIDGFAQGMAQSLRKGDPDRALGYSERVVANARRMNLLIEGFLALARASRAPLVDSPVDLQRLVHEVLAELPRPAAAHVEVAPLPRVRGDQATIRQVWQNLLSNAVKYSAKRERPVVMAGWTEGEAEVVFWVKDNGAGFDPDYADKLFTPFARLHKAEEFEGTGVGLALVRRIVERHGGRIWAQSRPGEGATFHFSIPRERLL